MEEDSAAMIHTIQGAVQAIGRGFDLNCDNRLLYCKIAAGTRLVDVGDESCRDIQINGGLVVPGVPRDVRCTGESLARESTGACSFDEMAEYFSRKAHLEGNIPLGSVNAAFSFTGSKKIDSSVTKTLAMDGKFITLCKLQLTRQSITLREDVKREVPTFWDSSSLARFIEVYGTHIVTSVTIGGKDVIYIKQHSSSSLPVEEIKHYIQEIGNQRFSEHDHQTTLGTLRLVDKNTEGIGFHSQGVYPQPPDTLFLSSKEDVTVIFRRRGGNDLVQDHNQWAKTVSSSPDVVHMTFFPITSLLDGLPGKDHLVRAINLYLEYKPPIEELRYFLEFQMPRVWAPVQDEIPGCRRKEPVCPSLQFSMMGKKMYVSQEQVLVGRRPVTGVKLRLEGAKKNRLCICVQHLASLPKILKPHWDAHISIGAPQWHGPEEQDSRWFELVRWRNFSHVSTAPVEHCNTIIGDVAGAYIVTGAQLGVWDFGSKNVLHMKMLYMKVPGCTIRRSFWDHSPTAVSSDDRVSSGEACKLAEFVDMSEMCKGSDDLPGHWLVTGGKLGVERGKIALRVKYSLMSY